MSSHDPVSERLYRDLLAVAVADELCRETQEMEQTDPVVRLEAWCDADEAKAIGKASGYPHKETSAIRNAYRKIITEYRCFETPASGEDYVVEDVLKNVIRILADALNPVKEPK